jgi:5-methylcytosine-specific restriction endonuclease McrBC GTP-binding regulatory subunit McrB
MDKTKLNQLWADFLATWTVERVRQMTLEQYTNPNKNDAFIYWLEFQLNDLGTIWGGSAFKFGIYCREKSETKDSKSGRAWGEKYAWLVKFGSSEQEAFATIRDRLIQVIEAVQSGNLARVEEIDLAQMFKWKVAFLYQNQNDPMVLPIFKKEVLFYNYRAIDPSAKIAKTRYHVMYETLMERHKAIGDVIDIAQSLLERYKAEQNKVTRAWAVPLAWTLQDYNAIETLCNKTHVEPEDVDSFLNNLLANKELAEGDELVFIVDADVRAVGTLINAEVGQYEWSQIPVNFPSVLSVNPTSEIRELTASEREQLHNLLPTPEVPEVIEVEETKTNEPRYWKIAPGRDAVAWPEWKDKGFVAIGWPKLGDLTNISRADFDKRADKCVKDDGYKKQGMSQVWEFRQIQPGDRVVANQGKHTVLGIGTVLSGYQYVPGKHIVDGSDYPHQIKVRWDDITPKTVNQYTWQKTLIKLTKDEFETLLMQDSTPDITPKKEEPPPPPCNPQNIILYGPPGTGKTYSTVRRALELILGSEQIAGLSEKALMTLFRDHQARGQIEFVTFHQAYGYEEFVEGIRPVLNQAADSQVRYEIHNGVFKRIALSAAAEGLKIEGTVPEFDELWDLLVRDIQEENTKVEKGPSGKTYLLSLTSQGNIQLRLCNVIDDDKIEVTGEPRVASKDIARLYWKHRAELGPEPEKFTYEKTKALIARERGGSGGNQYTSLWIVYTQLLALSRSVGTRKAELIDPIARVQQAIDKPGATTTFSFSALSPQYVLIIDEINRGNMSKIFGELMTLLEPDKRLTARNELKLPLSYSPNHRFAVPPNMHILGTMNTADRSIALMDVALRRRFTFEELMPNADVIRTMLQEKVENKAFIELVVSIFKALNNRIRFLYDRDHQLGHSYFLDVVDAETLRQVFKDRIIPMLQEYFYGDWDKICIVLGCPYNDSGEAKRQNARWLLDPSSKNKAYAYPIITAHAFPEVETLGFDHDDYEDRVDYHIQTDFQQGRLSKEDLYKTFLGTITTTEETFKQYLKELTEEPKQLEEPEQPETKAVEEEQA